MSDGIDWATRLEQDGLIAYGADNDRRATKRWHSALARAALRLYQDGEDLVDLRVPIAAALAERYETDAQLEDAIGVMLVVTMRELVAIARSQP